MMEGNTTQGAGPTEAPRGEVVFALAKGVAAVVAFSACQTKLWYPPEPWASKVPADITTVRSVCWLKVGQVWSRTIMVSEFTAAFVFQREVGG